MDRCNKEVNRSLGRDQRIDVMSQVQDLATSACTFVRGQGQHNNAVLKSPTVSAIHGTFRFLKAVLVIFSLLNQLYDTIEHWTLVDPGRRASAAKVPDSGGENAVVFMQRRLSTTTLFFILRVHKRVPCCPSSGNSLGFFAIPFSHFSRAAFDGTPRMVQKKHSSCIVPRFGVEGSMTNKPRCVILDRKMFYYHSNHPRKTT